MRYEEAELRHPLERRLFWVFVVLNFALLSAAVFIVVKGTAWLQEHPHLAHYDDLIRSLALAAVFGVPAMTFLRNTRHALMVGKSIAVSSQQFPQIHAILRKYCESLGMNRLPDLYFSDTKVKGAARAYTSWKCSYIVLSTRFLQADLEPLLPVIAFWIGREIGCLRLHHASFGTEFLLSCVDKIPYLSNPLRQVFSYSEDRYGAFLTPEGLVGLVALASGRRMLPRVSVSEYLKQVKSYGGRWSRLAGLRDREPTVSERVRALLEAGFLKGE